MNTTQLECFVQVADNLNFRRAADELHPVSNTHLTLPTKLEV